MMFKSLFKKVNQSIILNAPLEGTFVLLEEVPDQVFSEKMMGDGVAILPQNNRLVSPIDGEVVDVFPTKHAISLRSNEGAELLIHMGLETVNLKGEGFEINVKNGDKISKGTQLGIFDIEKIKKLGYEVITPIILLNGDHYEISHRIQQGEAVNHSDLIMELRKKG